MTGRQKRINAGLCVSCKERAEPGRTMCADHAADMRQRMRARYRQRLGLPVDFPKSVQGSFELKRASEGREE